MQKKHKSCGLLPSFCSHLKSGEIVRVGAQIAGHVVLIRGLRNAYNFGQKKSLKERDNFRDLDVDGGTTLSGI